MSWLALHLTAAVVSLSLIAACGGGGSDAKTKASETPTAVAPGDAALPLQPSPWRKAPSVVIVSARASDQRIAQAEDAVRFWNEQLMSLGSGLQLGPVKRVAQRTPDSLLAKLSQNIVNSVGSAGAGYSLNKADYDELTRGVDDFDLVVILSDGNFVSFSSGPLIVNGRSRSLVAIRSVIPVLAQPNVMPNVIAHEIGHSLGLQHNADVTKLMCGRPADCRPDAFASEDLHYFPLTEQDKARLLLLYPATWKPTD